ncbi:MAG: MFS transporter [Candidatus Margulisiibacteriota bacterium]|nr:MFS transporter [Candidatus Margulisiibacteriota bacterium]
MRLAKKLEYSFGAIATALSYQAFSTYIIFFYVDVVKLPASLAAVAMLIYAIWNAINDPIAGFVSDHTHTRWGRRIPYILFGAIPFGLIYFLVWTPPFTDFNQVFWLFLYFLGFICLFDTFYTVTILNWASLYPEMFPTLEERSEVNAYRQSFGMLGLILGIAGPPLIYGSLGWGWMGAIFGIIISLALLVALRGCFEHKQFCQEKQIPLLKSFKATLKNRSFLTFVFANLFVQYAFTIILASIPFFAKYVLNEGATGTAAILAAAFLTAIPMLYVWEKLTIRFGAKRCFMATMIILAVLLVPLFFVETFMAALISSALIGIGLAGFILIVDIILADIIDEDETNTGTRREGMYFGANAFITRFAIGLEAFSMGIVFVLAQYNPYIFTQTREFLSGLRLLIAGFPIVALLLAFLIMWFYPLSGKRLEELRGKVKKIHVKKGVI